MKLKEKAHNDLLHFRRKGLKINALYWKKRCCHFFPAVLDRIHLILSGNDDIHECLDEFEVWPDRTTGFHGNR